MGGSRGRRRHCSTHVQAGGRGVHTDVCHPEVRGCPHAVVCHAPTFLQGVEGRQRGQGVGGASGGRQLWHHTSWRIAIAGGGAATALCGKANTQHALQAGKQQSAWALGGQVAS